MRLRWRVGGVKPMSPSGHPEPLRHRLCVSRWHRAGCLLQRRREGAEHWPSSALVLDGQCVKHRFPPVFGDSPEPGFTGSDTVVGPAKPRQGIPSAVSGGRGSQLQGPTRLVLPAQPPSPLMASARRLASAASSSLPALRRRSLRRNQTWPMLWASPKARNVSRASSKASSDSWG